MLRSIYRHLHAARDERETTCCSTPNVQDRAVDQAMAPPEPVPVAAPIASSLPCAGPSDTGSQAQRFRDQGFVHVGELCRTPEDCAAFVQLGLDLSSRCAQDVAETAVLETQCGASLLRALEQRELCELLADIVGTDVQIISMQIHANTDPGSATTPEPCREYCRSESQLRTHGAFAHPFLSSDVKLLLPLSRSGVTVDLIPGSQHWIQGSRTMINCHSSEACRVQLGSALLVDMRTWRSYANEKPATGLFALEVHYSKVSC